MTSKKYIRHLRSAIIIIVIIGIVYFLLINGLTLHKIANRHHLSCSFREEDKQELIMLLDSATSEAEVIKRCNVFVCNSLSFHKNNDLKNGEANCVGYAQYSSAILNFAFSYKGLNSKARPVVGQVHLYGFNIHPLAMAILPENLKSFVKDHDFVEIQKENGETIFIDTSLQDLTGKSFI